MWSSDELTTSTPQRSLSRLYHAACTLSVYASQPGSPPDHATLDSGLWPTLAGQDSHLLGRVEGFRHVCPSTWLPPSPSFAWRNNLLISSPLLVAPLPRSVECRLRSQAPRRACSVGSGSPDRSTPRAVRASRHGRFPRCVRTAVRARGSAGLSSTSPYGRSGRLSRGGILRAFLEARMVSRGGDTGGRAPPRHPEELRSDGVCSPCAPGEHHSRIGSSLLQMVSPQRPTVQSGPVQGRRGVVRWRVARWPVAFSPACPGHGLRQCVDPSDVATTPRLASSDRHRMVWTSTRLRSRSPTRAARTTVGQPVSEGRVPTRANVLRRCPRTWSESSCGCARPSKKDGQVCGTRGFPATCGDASET